MASVLETEIELRHLRYFLAVAETDNFSRAAERLSVTQPAVSQQIKDLEIMLDTTLFDRVGKRVRLTQAGMAFQEHARAVMQKMSDACRSVEQIDAVGAGRLDIGVIPLVDVAWMPQVIAKFRAHYPNVKIAVRELPAKQIETEVEAGRLDMGIGLLPYSSASINYQRLCSVDLAVVVDRTHRWSKRKSVAAKELADEAVVLISEGFMLRQMIDDMFRRSRVRPNVMLELDTIEAVLAVALSAGAATLLPRMVLAARGDSELRAITLTGKNEAMDLGMIWSFKSDRGPAAKAFAEMMAELAGDNT
jgi:LysR family cyn operon transcriptional activator